MVPKLTGASHTITLDDMEFGMILEILESHISNIKDGDGISYGTSDDNNLALTFLCNMRAKIENVVYQISTDTGA